MEKWKNVFLVLGILTLGLCSYFYFDFNLHNKENFAYAENQSITIISLTKDNSLLGGAEYSITPDPYKMTGTLIVKDNSSLDSEKDKDGIITLSGVKKGNYTITQVMAPAGYDFDKLSKIVEVKDSSAVASFTNIPTSINSAKSGIIKGITYTAKFACGSVVADDGPLRPGHYDTDISILNKQKFQLTILWNVVANDGPSSNAVIKNLGAEASTGFSCKEIRGFLGLGDNSEKMVEGFAIIRIQLDSIIGSEKGTTIRNLSGDEINLLDVQAFYTANALSTAPHEVIIDKISFYIIQDGTGKIPKDMMRKPLDVSVPSNLNEISNTDTKIKNILKEKYGFSDEEGKKIIIRIKDVSVGVGALVDDHAISLRVVAPQASY